MGRFIWFWLGMLFQALIDPENLAERWRGNVANVIQAALWMKEGLRVRRPEIPGYLMGEWDDAVEFTGDISYVYEKEGLGEFPWEMSLRDLLAEDWEICPKNDSVK